MWFNKKYKPEACCEKSRSDLANPYLDTKNKLVVATDGRCLVAIKTDCQEEDVSGQLPIVALETTRKSVAKSQPCFGLDCDEDKVSNNYVSAPRSKVYFPDHMSIIKRLQKPGDAGTFTVTIDPKVLNKIIKAMALGSKDAITLTFNTDNALNPIRVENESDREGELVGVLIPMRTSGK